MTFTQVIRCTNVFVSDKLLVKVVIIPTYT